MGEYTTDVYNITNLTLNIRKRSVSLNESVLYIIIYDDVFSISDENISRLNKFKNRRYNMLHFSLFITYMKALKCKTLGELHIHHALSHKCQGPSIHTMVHYRLCIYAGLTFNSTYITLALYILRMRVRVSRCP